MRLFVALDLDEAIRDRLTTLASELKQKSMGVRFVGPETYHITLKFLGEVRDVDQIRDRLRAVHVPAFELSFRGLGFFPNTRSPRVFWAGVDAPPELSQLAQAINGALSGMGFKEEREFHPHITLARSGSGRPRPKPGDRSSPGLAKLAQLVTSIPKPEFGTMTSNQFFLYESRLSSRGASYYKLEAYSLQR